MRNIAVIDGNFDGSLTSTYHLSIQYGHRNFSFAILDLASMKYLAYKSIWFEDSLPKQSPADHIRTLLNSESYLTRTYKSISFIYQSPVSALVPARLFSVENPEIYLKYSSNLNPGDKVCFRKLSAVDSFIVFPVAEDLMDQANFMLRNVTFFHQACPQIETALEDSHNRKERAQVYACIHPGFADLILVKSEQLLFCNSFAIHNTQDLAYYLLYLYEQFGLPHEETPIILSGFTEMYDGLTDLLQRYIQQVSLTGFPAAFSYSDCFKGLPAHHLLPILNLARCE